MYRITSPPGKSCHSQLVLPEKHRKMVMESLHDDSGHLGFDKTYGLLKDRFYWPKMKSNVEEYCKLVHKEEDSTQESCSADAFAK